MLVHPQFDPIAIQLGPLAVHWYGLMYLVAFLSFLALGTWRANHRPDLGISSQDVDDMLFYGVFGVIIGGRLGEILFYEPAYYLAHPAQVFAIWQGGMSFHGGFIGVIAAMALFAWRKRKRFLQVTDFIAPLSALGLAAGRIGNFINGELWGRAADPSLPWAMVFPNVDNLPRHPSQLYQAGLEGILLFCIIWWYASKPRRDGQLSGAFLLGYGVMRSIGEFFREPDAGIFGHSYVVSMGQWLSVPMILLGLYFLLRRSKTA
ncbi:Prolipoprotein diacylglyceryl transferase [Sterolibacterium denitrificans]|uniref:Phosphatidylglycerol--prolipoprotein diacylglyceryl transferase n=1 Tax=Sterolibacterium denitrificans TaxID=157592 RepID=A0A7Z7MUX0_9PROT|nr:prolipoprotein diacylglyceryl transferase [Sterolibacterium denitrificans]SMB24489.1 Prolipoprotein diacylglyceryl transferase [Sterolibacterium denitrificans]